MTTKTTSFTEIIQQAISSRMSDTYHTLPGIVVAYYPVTQDADVQIAINDPRFDPDTDELTTEPWPIYPHMRVAWPRFGGFTIMGPLSVGQSVQCHFQDLDDSGYRVTGQQGDPLFTRRFGSNSCYCVPDDVTDAGIATDAAAAGSAMIIGKDGSQAEIRITSTGIQLGATGGDYVALASLVAHELGKIASSMATGSNTGGPVVFATPYVAGNVASALVKAQ